MTSPWRLGGPLPAITLGVAALAVRSPTLAQAPAPQSGANVTPEVVITATREADAVLTAKVEKALQDDPYVFTAHVAVVTENGVVKLEGIARDPSDLNRALMLARRAAGRRRVVNAVELMEDTEDNDF